VRAFCARHQFGSTREDGDMPEAVRRPARRRPALIALAVLATLGLAISLPTTAIAAPAAPQVKPVPSPATPPNNNAGGGQSKDPKPGTATAGPTTPTAPVSSPAAPAPLVTTSTASTITSDKKADHGAGAAPGTTGTGTGTATTGSAAAGPAKAAPQAGPQAAPPATRILIGPVAIPVARTAPLGTPVRANPFTARPASPFGPQVQRRTAPAAAVQGPRLPSRPTKARKPVRAAKAAPTAPTASAPGISPDAEVLPALTTVVRRAADEPTAPLLVALIVGVFLLVQHRIDRRDPKLARVRLDQEPLTFRRLSYS